MSRIERGDSSGVVLRKGRVPKWPRGPQVVLSIVFVAFAPISFPWYPENPGILSKKAEPLLFVSP